MADQKISAMTAVTNPASTDAVPIISGGLNKKVTIANLVANSNPASLTISGLTAGRVTYAGTAGLLSDDSGFTYNSATHALTTTTFVGALTGIASGNTLVTIVPNTAPSAGQILAGNAGGTAYAPVSMSGDATLASTGAITLASTISAGGPTGSATVAPIITYDAKGRLTTVSSATITPAVGSITGLGTGVATALAVNVGSAGAFVVNGGALGSPSSAGTIPAFTLGGTISGGGQQLNNIIIGTTTPLAGSFTTLVASTSTKTPIIFPASDSTTAVKITQADGSTAIVTVDSTNKRVGINKTPGAFDLDVNGAVSFASTLAVTSTSTLTGAVGVGGASDGTQLHVMKAGSATAVALVARIENTTTSTANGSGASVEFVNATDSGTRTVTGQIASVWSDNANANRAADLAFYSKLSGGANTEWMRIQAAGTIKFNTTNYNTCTALTTTAAVIGCTASDESLKQDVEPYVDGLTFVRQVEPRTFSFKKGNQWYDEGRLRLGLIAQDVQKALPMAVWPIAPNQPLQIDYQAVTAAHHDALRRLDGKLEMLNERLAALCDGN